MLTTCPKCNLSLVVTVGDLRAALGHVRCGRCHSVFNALESLAESPPEPQAAAAHAFQEVAPHLPDAIRPYIEEQAAEHAAPSVENQPPQAQVLDEAASERTDVMIEAHALVLEEQPPQAPALDAAAHERTDMTIEAHALVFEEQPPESVATAHPSPAEPAAEPAAAELEPAAEFSLDTTEARHTGAWLMGTLVLALLLAGQIVNHYRGSLATLPSIGPSLRAFYGKLGIPVDPLWNVHAYDARQLGATGSSTHPDQITVRASIANMGRWPLPLPLLRITLQDRYGRTIAARDVAPQDYLSAASNPAAMLASGQRVDATVTFVSPGPQAIGFEIDTCLREAGSVVCTHGPQ